MNAKQQFPAVFPRITIKHNHGVCILENAVLEAYEWESNWPGHGREVHKCNRLRGTCVGGGETSRLLHATSHTAYPRNVERVENIYGRTPYLMKGYTAKDGTVHADEWYVDNCTCG